MERGPPCSRLKGLPRCGGLHGFAGPDGSCNVPGCCCFGGGDLCLERTRPGDYGPVIQVLRAAGCRIEEGSGEVRIHGPERLQSVPPIRTAPYPGFPTDAQAPVMAALLRAQGVTVFEETVFADRYRHVPALGALGGRIQVSGAIAAVTGGAGAPWRGHGSHRPAGWGGHGGGCLGAQGTSRIGSVQHILRGYEDFARRLAAPGRKPFGWNMKGQSAAMEDCTMDWDEQRGGAGESPLKAGPSARARPARGGPSGGPKRPGSPMRAAVSCGNCQPPEEAREPKQETKEPAPGPNAPAGIRNRRASRNSVSGTHLEIGRWRKKPEKPAADRPGKRSGSEERKRREETRRTPPKALPRRKLLWKLLTTAAVVVALLVGLTIFFKVQNVVVTGNGKYTAETVIAASGIETGRIC